MKLEELGYTDKWIEYGILTNEILTNQFSEFQKIENQHTEHYRYGTLKNWLNQKNKFTNLEINRFIELAFEDPNELMAGSAVKELFTHPDLSEDQFNLIKIELSKFGEWTDKLIQREVLKKRILAENVSDDLIQQCIVYRKSFNDNSLINLIIDKVDRIAIIEQFTSNDFGKRIRNQASEKIRRIKKR